ncbi:MAG: hypothetical protein RIB98_04260 [Acidimicrobiales bacterium]
MERRDALITGVVLGLMFAAIATLIVMARSDETDRLAFDPDVSSTPDDPTTDEPTPDDPAPDGGEFDAFVDEAIVFVEETRGGRFLTRPIVVTLGESDFVARVTSDLAADFAEAPDEVEVFNATYRALALIGPDERIDEVYGRFGEAGILGFYDPTTDELVVRQRDELSLLTKSTIVHELTHAWDDQHFDLDRPEYDDRTDEIGWGFIAVAEGSATWVEAEWEATLDSADRGALLQEELGFSDPGIIDEFTLAFLLLELSPYEYGEPFVTQLVESGGITALDTALTEPPVTSEQVMSPDRYDTQEGPIDIPAPPADGEVLYSGLGGDVVIESILAGTGVVRDFEWGGDQLVVWTADGQSCIRWDIQAEDGSTASVRSAFETWGSRVGDVEVSEVDSRTVRIDRCV